MPVLPHGIAVIYWYAVMLQSPATPTIAASQYMYPMQTLPPEMIYAQLPPQAAFQPGDLGDGSVIETAPAEVGHSSTHFYDVHLCCYVLVSGYLFL